MFLFFFSLSTSIIIYNTTSKVFTLHTRNSTYQLYIGHLGYLLHLYYGQRIESTEMTHLVQLMGRDFDGNLYEDGYIDRSFSLNFVRQEYATYGGGDYRVPCLEVTNPDGTSAVDLRYLTHRIYGSQPKPAISGLPYVFHDDTDSLEIDLYDKYTNVVVTLKYSTLDDYDVITRSALIRNQGSAAVFLTRAMSASLELPSSGQETCDICSPYGDIVTQSDNDNSGLRKTSPNRNDPSRKQALVHRMIQTIRNLDIPQKGERSPRWGWRCYGFAYCHGMKGKRLELKSTDRRSVGNHP
jgi:alpha-galactosidase